MKCSCVPCKNPTTNRVPATLNWQQKDMLGYFCSQCILAKCDFRHKVIPHQRKNGLWEE